jgi:hypothetical protein
MRLIHTSSLGVFVMFLSILKIQAATSLLLNRESIYYDSVVDLDA